jgi:hypothetical protein
MLTSEEIKSIVPEYYSLEVRIEMAARILGVPEHAIKETMSGIIPEIHQRAVGLD